MANSCKQQNTGWEGGPSANVMDIITEFVETRLTEGRVTMILYVRQLLMAPCSYVKL